MILTSTFKTTALWFELFQYLMNLSCSQTYSKTIHVTIIFVPSPEYQSSLQESSCSIYIPHHRFSLRHLHTRKFSVNYSTLIFSALSSISGLRLVRKHTQSLFSETHSQNLFHNHILHQVWTQLLYCLLTLKLHTFQSFFSLKI